MDDCSLANINRRKLYLVCVALALVTLLLYAKVCSYPFFSFDEDDYVINNPHIEHGLTLGDIAWSFTSIEAFNWHPVTWLSHMLVATFFGMDPGAHHLANILIHTISSILLLFLLFRMTGQLWPSSFVAFLFAIHPMHVESVAWVAERKDVLSAFFGFTTLLLYVRYIAKHKTGLYFLSLFSFLLCLMSKPMLVTLPAVMLLVDFHTLRRHPSQAGESATVRPWRWYGALLTEKIPFLACSLLSSYITIYAQNKGGALDYVNQPSLMSRMDNALVSYVKYICKIFYPVDLSVLYPMPAVFPLWQVGGSLVILILFSAAAIAFRRTKPYLAFGWFWFVITLVPVIGFIRFGAQSMADRYTYIPAIGIFIIVAWGISDMLDTFRYKKYLLVFSACATIALSAALTWRQTTYWKTSVALFRHSLQVNPDNYMLNNCLGIEFAKHGYVDAAVKRFREALRINPNDSFAHNNLGRIFANNGEFDTAIAEYNEALRLNPNLAIAKKNLAEVVTAKNNYYDRGTNPPAVDFRNALFPNSSSQTSIRR